MNQDSVLPEGVLQPIQRIKDKLGKLFRSAERTRLLILLGLISMGMIFCSELFSTPKSQEDATSPVCQQEVFSSEAYIQSMEQRLREILSQIDGVGECSIMVTLKESSRRIFASEDKTSQEKSDGRFDLSSEKRLVLLEDKSGAEYPVVETTLSPQIKGVMIVCKGAKSARVLGIRSIQVCVSPRGR